MRRYYTRACNFYYGKESKILISKKKTLPLNGLQEISFDHIEIITRKSKKKIFIKDLKKLSKKLQKKIIKKKKNTSFKGSTKNIIWPNKNKNQKIKEKNLY